ncbi:MAG: hypothetical protein NT170_01515 [Candidatus Moranbacteria bacterium]|nr:hypothetical protein [Candidatus Moranbacteria bacterium]
MKKLEQEPIAMPESEEYAAKDYIPFDPKEELHKIQETLKERKDMPLNERLELKKTWLEEFKLELTHQEAGTAKTIIDMNDAIHKNPDIQGKDLFALVQKGAPRFRLTENQLENFEHAANEYERRHKIVESYRLRYPDDAELFHVVFGLNPKGLVKVLRTPISLHFYCNPIDYERAFHHQTISRFQMLTEDDLATITGNSNTQGLAFSNMKNTELNELVTIGKFTGSKEDDTSTMIHEEQHQLNKLFIPTRLYSDSLRLLPKLTPDTKEYLTEFMKITAKASREYFGLDKLMRDETIAQYKGGCSTASLYKVLSGFYMPHFRKYIEKNIPLFAGQIEKAIKENYKWSVNYPLRYNPEQINQVVEYALDDGFKKDIKKWIKGIDDMEKRGYKRDAIVAFLYQAPSAEWTGIAKRASSK